MKKLVKVNFLLAGLGVLLVAACHSASDKIVSFIPGTYVHSAKGEYSQAQDTPVIKLLSGEAYQIRRRTGFQPIREGKLLPKRYLVRVLNGNYDPQKQVLFETTNGRVFTFDPDKGVMLVSSAVYRN